MKFEQLVIRTTRAAQPLPAQVGLGTLAFITDEHIVERSNGLAWEPYSAPYTAAPPAGTVTYTYSTWIPSLGGEGGESGGSMSTAVGRATKISNGVDPALIVAQGTVVIGVKPSITGTVVVRGFPYPAGPGLEARSGAIRFGAMVTNWIAIGGYIEPGNTFMVLKGTKAAGVDNDTPVTSADVGVQTSIRFLMSYWTLP